MIMRKTRGQILMTHDAGSVVHRMYIFLYTMYVFGNYFRVFKKFR